MKLGGSRGSARRGPPRRITPLFVQTESVPWFNGRSLGPVKRCFAVNFAVEFLEMGHEGPRGEVTYGRVCVFFFHFFEHAVFFLHVSSMD